MVVTVVAVVLKIIQLHLTELKMLRRLKNEASKPLPKGGYPTPLVLVFLCLLAQAK